MAGKTIAIRDIAYSFKCEHCGKDSGWLIWRSNVAGL